MRRLAVVVFAACAITTSARAQSVPPRDANVTLHVSVVGGQRPFRIGETIPIQLDFSAAFNDRYQVNMASYDRSGRMEYEHFRVSPSDGSVDPLASRGAISFGGLTSFAFLSAKPWTMRLNVNEWVRFTHPGTYRLDITSDRIARKNPAVAAGTSRIIVVANPITLTIVPSTADWLSDTFERARAVLNQPAPEKPDGDRHYNAQREALDTLRFLGSPDAVRELVNRLGRVPGGDSICVLGLISAPDPAIAIDALDAALADPDRPIDSQFVGALQTVGQDRSQWQQNRQRAMEKVVAALPKKRDRALSISLFTAVNEAWNFAPVPAGTMAALVRQLIARFDDLPVEQQSMLLNNRWDKIASPAMLPIVRRSAAGGSASALQHWYELDPVGGREAILAEITSANPRFGVETLGILPDKVLPELDAILARHFVESKSSEQSRLIGSLIARYATGAILTTVLAKMDPELETWPCGVPRPMLAYALRVNPALAGPRIEKVLAFRRTRDYGTCAQDLLTAIAEIHYDPILEDVAVRALDDRDGEVVRTGATLLGQYGSPRAESVLLEHYKRWTARWAGRETELNPAAADRGSQNDAIWEGETLLHALTTGTSWMTDASKLQSLLSITKAVRLRQMLDGQLKVWSTSPLTVTINAGAGSSIETYVAQYRFRTMNALETKLAQFPVGTTFELRLSGEDSPAKRARDASLTGFLGEHGMIVVPAK